MITRDIPNTWQDLQAQVARILSQCGFSVELEKVVDLGRGKAEIDVYAEESVRGRQNLVICECKRWKSAVPQQVVHAFRTVVSDAGANVGYIIGLGGFQSGAFQAAEKTNVRLVSWEEFQAEFEATWLEVHFVPHLTGELDPLMSYVEPFAPAWFDKLDEGDQDAFVELVKRHGPLGALVMRLSTYSLLIHGGVIPALPVRAWDDEPWIEALPDDVLDATGYADLEAVLLRRGRIAIAEFRRYRQLGLGAEAES